MNFFNPQSLSVTFYSEGAVLYQPGGDNRLRVLDSTAAIIWCLLPEVDCEEELIDRLVKDYSLDRQAAAETVKLALTQFADHGLLVGTSPPEKPSPRTHQLPTGDQRSLSPQDIPSPYHFNFTLADQSFVIQYQNHAVGAYLADVFGHLAGEDIGDEITELSIVHNELKTYDLYLEDKRRANGLQIMEVVPWLSALVFEHCCQALKHYLLLHAGVVVRDKKAVLLPARSGSGKSTLVAALAAKGWRYFSDELALIDTETGKVLPFPQSMGIKAGSVSPLSRYYPGLEALPSHRRIDEREVRFLAPFFDKRFEKTREGVEIAALYFPVHLPKVKAERVRLSPLEALRRLAGVGSSPRPITDGDIETLIYLADDLPCYLLFFDSLEIASEIISSRC